MTAPAAQTFTTAEGGSVTVTPTGGGGYTVNDANVVEAIIAGNQTILVIAKVLSLPPTSASPSP